MQAFAVPLEWLGEHARQFGGESRIAAFNAEAGRLESDFGTIAKRAKQAVPARKHAAEIAVRLLPRNGMMQRMHVWRDEQQREPAID